MSPNEYELQYQNKESAILIGLFIDRRANIYLDSTMIVPDAKIREIQSYSKNTVHFFLIRFSS